LSEIRVLVVDDHALVREMLSDRIDAESDMRVVGQAGTADDAVRSCSCLQPSIALLDIDLPGISAFDAARTMSRVSPGTKVIFLSAFIHDGYIAQALDVHAAGYLSKATPPDEVVAAIRDVNAGRTAMSEEVLDRVLITGAGDAGGQVGSRGDLLTQREREVLAYVAQGLLQKQIARRLGISIKTVQTHLTHAMAKLEIHDRVELTRYAIREGIVKP